MNSQNTDSEKDDEDMNINAALVGMSFHAAGFFFSSEWIHSLLSEPIMWSSHIPNFRGSSPQMG